METGLDVRLTRKLAGQCLHCSNEAADGSAYCAHHDAHEKGRDRARKKKRRQALAAKGLCAVFGCGKKVGKRRIGKRIVQTRECATCAELHRKRTADARSRVRPGSGSCVPSAPTTPLVKLEVGRDGATRTRYVPRAGQGGPSREETRRSRSKLVADAARLVAVWQANYDEDTHAAIDALPRIQRTEAVSLRTSALVRALRLLGLVAEEEDPTLRGTCTGCGRAHAEE